MFLAATVAGRMSENDIDFMTIIFGQRCIEMDVII